MTLKAQKWFQGLHCARGGLKHQVLRNPQVSSISLCVLWYCMESCILHTGPANTDSGTRLPTTYTHFMMHSTETCNTPVKVQIQPTADSRGMYYVDHKWAPSKRVAFFLHEGDVHVQRSVETPRTSGLLGSSRSLASKCCHNSEVHDITNDINKCITKPWIFLEGGGIPGKYPKDSGFKVSCIPADYTLSV